MVVVQGAMTLYSRVYREDEPRERSKRHWLGLATSELDLGSDNGGRGDVAPNGPHLSIGVVNGGSARWSKAWWSYGCEGLSSRATWTASTTDGGMMATLLLCRSALEQRMGERGSESESECMGMWRARCSPF